MEHVLPQLSPLHPARTVTLYMYVNKICVIWRNEKRLPNCLKVFLTAYVTNDMLS